MTDLSHIDRLVDERVALNAAKKARAFAVPPFLRDANAALRWARRNADLSFSDDRVERAEEVAHYRDLAADYTWFAHEAVQQGEVKVYRRVCLEKGQAVDLQDLGKAWSRVPAGAGCYGSAPRGGREVLIVGIVRAEDVDWKYGLTSFMYYGRDQWEVSLKPNVPVRVLAVGDEVFDPPAAGNSGRAQEDWHQGRET